MSLHILWRRGPVLIARGRARQSRPVSGVAGENDFRTLRLGVLRQKSDHGECAATACCMRQKKRRMLTCAVQCSDIMRSCEGAVDNSNDNDKTAFRPSRSTASSTRSSARPSRQQLAISPFYHNLRLPKASGRSLIPFRPLLGFSTPSPIHCNSKPFDVSSSRCHSNFCPSGAQDASP